MKRMFAMLAALSASTGVISATTMPASAAVRGYRAEAVAPVAPKTVVAGDLLWKCDAGGCSANRSGARAEVVCAQVARRVGKLTSFKADESAFDTEALARCNAKAPS